MYRSAYSVIIRQDFQGVTQRIILLCGKLCHRSSERVGGKGRAVMLYVSSDTIFVPMALENASHLAEGGCEVYTETKELELLLIIIFKLERAFSVLMIK